MKHIAVSGCGWAITGGSYTCAGLPKLDEVFRTTTVTGNTITGTTISYDNFDRLPQHIEGFRMTLSPIIDMSGTSAGDILEVPELACRTDFDPFDFNVVATGNTESTLTINPRIENQGFLDLYNSVNSYHDKVYVLVDGATHYMKADDTFPVYDVTDQMSPGVLEPMLNTEFGPVGVDVPTTPDLTTDAIIYSLAGLQSWRHTIDTSVSNLNLNTFNYGMQGLEVAKNLDSPCQNFQIRVISGLPLAPVSSFVSSTLIPKYEITGGVIKVNGVQVAVGGSTTPWTAPFHAYLDISSDTTTHAYSGSLVSAAGTYSPAYDHTAVYIGGVTVTSNDFADSTISALVSEHLGPGEKYREYEIHQGDCITDVELLTAGSNGYVYMTVVNGGRQYTTDALLNSTEFENLSAANGSRGVQAAAISAYIEEHGGGGGTGDGRLYPNYAELTNGESNPPSGRGIGVTYVLPVSSGQRLGYMTEAPDNCFVRYAPAEGETGTPFMVPEGGDELLEAEADGFVRFSILDDGLHAGTCVRFIVDDSEWDAGLPVYRFGDFHPSHEYMGPFKISVLEGQDGIISVTCPICGGDIAGYYRVNGGASVPVTEKTIDGATEATTDIYAHVYQTGPVIIDNKEDTGASANPPSYTAWLGRVSGKIKKARPTGQTYDTYFGGEATQVQYGDIQVVSATAGTAAAAGYTGPFAVTVDANDVYHISCPSCGSNANSAAIIGWYSIDGQYETEVTGDYSGPVGEATAVYFHKTATTMTIDTTPGNTTDPTDYTVRLARISGGTAYQLHFGNIFMDGRWNTPEPPPPYTVTAGDGTGDGSLFSALSARSDPEIYIDASLNGQPLDFNGASVL